MLGVLGQSVGHTRRRVIGIARRAPGTFGRATCHAVRHPVGASTDLVRTTRSVARTLAPATAPMSRIMVGRGLTRRLAVLDVALARELATRPGTGEFIGTPADADDAVVRRLVDAAALPDLLAREAAAAILEVAGADAVAIFIRAKDEPRIIGRAGADQATAAALVKAALAGTAVGGMRLITEPLGGDKDGPRVALVALSRPLGHLGERRLRMVGAVARQGFELSEARERPARVADAVAIERPLEPLIPGFLCAGAAMGRLVDQIKRLQGNQLTVLITGESGTGKELVARALHRTGTRHDGPFVAINCAAVPEALLESELFGHVRGAFTDARTSRTGLFVQANGGTLFLDEIGDMPLSLQPKLLRVLQERAVRPVGGDALIACDVRVIAATNQDLEKAVQRSRFREDLYFRVNVIQVTVPPLRTRGHDVLLLAQHFIERYATQQEKAITGLTSAAAERLLSYPWPGNVRELQNCMEAAVTLARSREIGVGDLSVRIRRVASIDVPTAADDATAILSLDEIERRHILRVLETVRGNRTLAARALGLDRKTLYRKLLTYGISSDQFKPQV
jgi:DNA-binding NtrC family response regulator